jgi:hypothetical protein
MVGLDVRYCGTGEMARRMTARPFPEWMYGANLWRGYLEMFNLYAIQEAGQQFAILLGVKSRVYGRDGYTSFVPPDSDYDPARVALHLRAVGPEVPPGERSGAAETWSYPAVELLGEDLSSLSLETRKVLFFVPYNHVLLPPVGSPAADAWSECKRRVADLAAHAPNTLAVDFMLSSPITEADDNYWDALHYRAAIADRIANDLAAAGNGASSSDYRILSPAPESASR